MNKDDCFYDERLNPSQPCFGSDFDKAKHQKPARTSHTFTEAKVKMLMEIKGMELTGYILTNSDTNRFALVDKGRVRWYSFEEGMVILGHEEK